MTNIDKKRTGPQVGDVREKAQGRWLEIFEAICPGMFTEAIESLGSHVTCPFHGGEKDFRLLKRSTKSGRGNTASEGVAMCTCGVFNDGFAVLSKATGESFPKVLQRVSEYLGGTTSVAPRVAPPTQLRELSPEEEANRLAEVQSKIDKLWSAGRELTPTFTTYYGHRGIDARVLLDLQDVRFMRSLGYFEDVRGADGKKRLTRLGNYPALLAAMRDPKGNLVAVHRTFLAQDLTSKAPVTDAKKLSETTGVGGSAARLFDATGCDTLGVCEGIETAIAARQLTAGRFWPEMGAIPVWACYAERTLRSFVVPPELRDNIKKLVIFADNDESGTGLKAAISLKERLYQDHPDLRVVIKLPAVVGWDWLDVLLNL